MIGARTGRSPRAGALAGLLLLACGGGSAPPPPPAPAELATARGAVLEVDGLPLAADEVEPLVQDVALLYPEYSRLHARRLALTNVFLPRLAARAAAGERWAAARAACERADGLDELEAWRGEGTYHGLGLALWSAARRLEPGAWSAPLELAGRWVRVRVDERVEAADPREELLRLAVVSFPYLDTAEPDAVEAAIDRARLTLLDPEWAEAVPENWKHRMRGSKP